MPPHASHEPLRMERHDFDGAALGRLGDDELRLAVDRIPEPGRAVGAAAGRQRLRVRREGRRTSSAPAGLRPAAAIAAVLLSQICSRESGSALVTAIHRPSGLQATASGLATWPAGGRFGLRIQVFQAWRAVPPPLLTSSGGSAGADVDQMIGLERLAGDERPRSAGPRRE